MRSERKPTPLVVDKGILNRIQLSCTAPIARLIRHASSTAAVMCALLFLVGCPGQTSDSLTNSNDNSQDNPPGQNIPDGDSDGVADVDDRCADTPADAAVDIFGCPSQRKDVDGDGVEDEDDLCPDTNPADAVDERGCGPGQEPDADGDGVADASDLCPDTRENAEVNSDGCADSQFDSDGDGLADDRDNCSDTIANAAIDEDGCAAHQRDGDDDGVTDNIDDCPHTPPNINVDSVGCPAGNADSPDSDGDGVNDDVDLCPTSPADVEVDGNGCADGERDSDEDGVPDSEDQCPGTTTGQTVGADGCVLSPGTSGGGGDPGGGEPDCVHPQDCDDQNPCTIDDCSAGSCSNAPIDGCTPCTIPADCDDQDPCTSDICAAQGCSNPPIEGCIRCEKPTICPPIEVVFLMDTSTSMVDEAGALCSSITSIVDEVAALGVNVTPHFLGITQTRDDLFPCLTDNVVNLLGSDVPGTPTTCVFPDNISSYESWGPATAIVAERFSWSDETLRVIVPLSDEGPCNGSFPEGCNDPGDDRASIDSAVAVANTHGVVVSPVAGTGSSDCVLSLASLMANGTGGLMSLSQNPPEDIAAAIFALIANTCEPDVTCDDENPCSEIDTCTDGVCSGTDIPGCVRCDVPEDCADSNTCTDDLCTAGVCENPTNFDGSASCCNPQTGELTSLDTDNACTIGECNIDTGEVVFVPIAAEEEFPCDDGDQCTVLDVCNGEGMCVGTEVETLTCDPMDPNACFGRVCNDGGFCACHEAPELCVKPTERGVAANDCPGLGEELTFDVTLSASSYSVTGGQFLISYDPAQLEFVNLQSGNDVNETSPFSLVLSADVDEANGKIFYAVGVNIGSSGTFGPDILGAITFRVIEGCSSTDICFIDEDPKSTKLIDINGDSVPFNRCCTTGLFLDGGAPTMVCPESVDVTATPGRLSAKVEWDQIQSTGGCGETLDMSCTATNAFAVDIDDLIATGGTMPSGLSEFECTVEDACGRATSCSWNVDVRPANLVSASLELQPPMAAGPLERCIVFEFYSSCFEPAVVIERNISFGLPFDAPGRAEDVEFEVLAKLYGCVSTRDEFHTLRSAITPRIVGNRYVLDVLGDPDAGGHWLIPGDLNGDGIVNNDDRQIVLSQLDLALEADTPCGSRAAAHADINGDGTVDVLDLDVIDRNFGATAGRQCCPN